MQENKEIFDEISANAQESNKVSETVEETDNKENSDEDMVKAPKKNDFDFDFGDLSDNEKKDVEIKEEDLDDKNQVKGEYVIESAEILKPITRDVDGNLIEPKPFNEKKPEKKGYQSKVKITYKDSTYVSIIPNVKWYVGPVNQQTGKRTLRPWFNTNVTKEKLDDNFTSEISKVYFKFCEKFGYEPGKLTQQEFIRMLVDKKVKLKQWSTEYEGKKRYRIDIKEFV